MNKYLLSAALSVVAFAASSQAAVLVSIASNPASGAQVFLASPSVNFIADGSHVRIGTFTDGGGAHVEPAANSTFSTLNSSFHEFATLASGHTAGTGLNEGRINFTGITGAAGGDPDSFFVNKKIYIWVYNAPSPGAGAAPADSPTLQQGVYSTSTLVFLDQAAAVSFSLNNATRAYGAYTEPGGTQASSNNAVDNGVTVLRLAQPGIIPEPSTSALFVAFAGSLLLIRRRK